MKFSIIFITVAVLAVASGKSLRQRKHSLDHKASHLHSRKSNVHPNLRHDDERQQQERTHPINPAPGGRFLESSIRKTKKHSVSGSKKLHQSQKKRKEQSKNHHQQSLEETSSENVLPLETQLAIRSLVAQTRSLCRDFRDVVKSAIPEAKELSKKMFNTLTTKSSMRSGSSRKAMMSDIRTFLSSTSKDMKSLIPKTRALFRASNRNRITNIFQIIQRTILEFMSKFMAGFKGLIRRIQDTIKGGGKLAYSDIYHFIEYILDIYKAAFKLPFEILNIVFGGLFGGGGGGHHQESTTQDNSGDGTTNYLTTEPPSENNNPSTTSESSSEDPGSVHVLTTPREAASNQGSSDEGGSTTSQKSSTIEDSDSNLIFSDESGSSSSTMKWSTMPTLNSDDTSKNNVESITLFPEPIESRQLA